MSAKPGDGRLSGRLLRRARWATALLVLACAAVTPVGGAAPFVGGDSPTGAKVRLGGTRFRPASHCLAYSPDGKILATGGADGSVTIWDAATGKEIRSIPGHKKFCVRLAFSPDGKEIASVGWEESVILVRNVATGNEAGRLVGHEKTAHAVAFSPTGTMLASVGLDGATLLWCAIGGGKPRNLPDAGRHPCCVAFAPDGELVAAGGHDNVLRVWETDSGKEIHKLASPASSAALSAEFSRDGKRIATGWMDGSVSLWDAKSGKEIRRWKGPRGYVYSTTFSPDGSRLAVSWYVSPDPGKAACVRVFDTTTGEDAVKLAEPTGTMYGVCFSPDGKTIAAIDGKAVRRWDAATGKELLTGGHRGQISSAAVSPDGRTVYTAGYDARVIAWDAETGKERFTLAAHTGWVLNVRASADGKLLATSGSDPTLWLWDAVTGKAKAKFTLPARSIRAVALSPDGKRLAVGGDGRLRVYNVADEKVVFDVPGGAGYFGCLAFSPDGKRLAVYENDRYQYLRVRDAETGAVLGSHQGMNRIYGVAFSPDGHSVAVAASGQSGPDRHVVRLHVVEKVDEVTAVLKGHETGVTGVAWSPDGRSVASSGRDGVVRVWEVASGKERAQLAGHKGPVHAVAFSGDGRTLVSGGEDTSALVWDMEDRVKAFRREKAPTAAQLESWWADLASESAPRAYDAVCRLAAFPETSVPFLRERVAKEQPDSKAVARFVRELGDDAFAVRERASAALKKWGRLIEPDLRAARRATKDLETVRRLEALLEALPETSEGLRPVRAMEAQEMARRASMKKKE